jgi:hypothetical protein
MEFFASLRGRRERQRVPDTVVDDLWHAYDNAPELCTLSTCSDSARALFRRLQSTSRIIFDAEHQSDMAQDAHALSELGLVTIIQRVLTEMEVFLSPRARELLEIVCQREFEERNAAPVVIDHRA